ncbi:MFS transporter [Streptomyces sp. PTM05]|uniref:MFS transporter n=1 Tax=Streptantibioticus parmotrematis TaxID=2873249 RepID=A0ABS7QS48_9ACTN|nr:MFS transporter [Streptantibioticus parmotrematis]MBY8886013.1 MFS transporter [Streptantibioticus parmotrematis]
MREPVGLRAVLDVTGPWLPLISFLARLPAGLCPTGTLVMVTSLGGIRRAGLVAGCLWAGQAAGGPFIGRLADRRGQRPVLLTASLLNATATAALVASALGSRPTAVQAVCATVAGLTVPQVGPLSRSRWVGLVRGRPDAPALAARAVSLDTTLDEVGFMVGPALVGVLALLVGPAAGVGCAAVLMLVFGTAFALHPTAPPGAPAAPDRTEPLLSPSLIALCGIAVSQGCLWGATNAGINALAHGPGEQGVAGLVWSAMAVTSTLAGLAVTVRSRGPATARQLRTAVACEAVLTCSLLWVRGFAGATAAVAAIGCAVAPLLIAVFGLAARTAPAARMGEAMTLLGSGLIAGQGMAAMAAGQVASAHGPGWAFGLACAAGACASAAAFGFVRTGVRRPVAVDPTTTGPTTTDPLIPPQRAAPSEGGT